MQVTMPGSVASFVNSFSASNGWGLTLAGNATTSSLENLNSRSCSLFQADPPPFSKGARRAFSSARSDSNPRMVGSLTLFITCPTAVEEEAMSMSFEPALTPCASRAKAGCNFFPLCTTLAKLMSAGRLQSANASAANINTIVAESDNASLMSAFCPLKERLIITSSFSSDFILCCASAQAFPSALSASLGRHKAIVISTFD
mmetsp:Transcript_44527/g.89944  ORF Transcript_44527/g.89944 Transcript_44527/m.89944 type:complete len:202 (+) Transcript_44527:1205-1810(+)